jgi:hypothetical protein
MPNVSSPAAAANAAQNGGGPSDLDLKLAEELRAVVAQRQVRADELKTELEAIGPELRRYEKALALLTEEVQLPGKPRGAKAGRKRGRRPGAARGISDERLGEVKDAILKITQRQDEFRQADVLAEGRWGSGPVAIAFEHLRREKVIRLARKDPPGTRGGGNWFRLTQSALSD